MHCLLGMFTTWRRARQKCKGIRRKSREVKLWALQVNLYHQHHQRQGMNAKFVPSKDRGQRNCSACMVILETGAFNLHIFICANKFSSVTQSCLTLCNPMDSSMPGLPITNSRSLLKLMSIESVMPSNHLILCRSLHLLPSIFPSIRVFSNGSAVCIRWPKYWSFSFIISPSNE